MKKYYLALPLAMAAFILMGTPESASAHETHIYRIGNQYYRFTVGSLNEPIAVDDTIGVDLRVNRSVGPQEVRETETPVEGLDQTLKVELIAGDKKKTLDLRPAFRDPGAYRAKFYPTVQTTYTYRFFGTLNNVPVDLSFTCNPAGHPQTEADTSEVSISDQITRTLKRGAFGCPEAKADLGFPEQSASIYDLTNKDASLENAVTEARKAAQSSRSFGIAGIVIGLLGLAAGVGARMKRKV